jgi:hypothetical protein
MTARSFVLSGHAALRRPNIEQTAPGVATTVHWVHVLAALGWVVTVAVIAGPTLPAVRRLLSVEVRRRFDSRLEAMILASGVLTAIVIVTEVYELKHSTPYPAPFLSAPLGDVVDLPYAKPYFLVLAAQSVGYALMLVAAAAIIRRARSDGAALGDPRIDSPVARPGPRATTSAVLLESPYAATAPAKRFVLAPATFGAGAAVLLLCVGLRSSLHAKIESAPPPPPDPLTAEHVAGAAPAFTKVAVAGAGANAWDVTLTLSDLHTRTPVTSVLVSVTGEGPGGAKSGPTDFVELDNGGYRGRVSGPAGSWELHAAAVNGSGGDVPPTQQSFDLQLTNPPPPAASGPAS